MRKQFPYALAGILTGAASALLLSASAEAQAPQRGGTVIFTVTGDPLTFNPSIQTNVVDEQVGCIVYQTLIQYDHSYKMMPNLAKSWTISPDGLVYTFMLNKADWHDGKPFTSTDVKYTLEEVSKKYSSVFNRAGEAIDKIDTPAPDKVVITLKYSFGPFMVSLGCMQGAALLPEHLLRGTDVRTNPITLTNPVGTGPFVFKEWKRGEYIRFERNPNYFVPGKPYLDGVVAKVIPQNSARTAAVHSGEADVTRNIPSSDKPSVDANPKLTVVEDDAPPSYVPLFFNVKRKPLDDKRVRHALMMAIDRDYLIKNAWLGIGQVGRQPLPRNMGWTVDEKIDYNTMYPFNVDKANALLDQAGVTRGADGKRFKISVIPFQGYPEFDQVTVALKAMWGKVGVDLTIESLEPATFLKRVHTDSDFDTVLNGYSTYADPALGIVRMFATGMINKPFGNAANYSNPKVDELFAQGESRTDLKDRAKYYNEAQEILADDLPVIMLREYRQIDAVNKKLHGAFNIAEGMLTWEEAWLEK